MRNLKVKVEAVALVIFRLATGRLVTVTNPDGSYSKDITTSGKLTSRSQQIASSIVRGCLRSST